MPKAIFHRDINLRAPKKNLAISITASDKPQSFPAWVVEQAVERGAAERVPVKRKNTSSEEAG